VIKWIIVFEVIVMAKVESNKKPPWAKKFFEPLNSTIEEASRIVKVSPMMEELGFGRNTSLIVFNESACNKYIFSEHFFADIIVFLDIL